MYMSKMFIPTLKEVPNDAEITSHQLMIRAGMIRKLTSGVYNYLTLGIIALRKVEKIVREEMNKSGAQEILGSCLLPANLWEESGRWDIFGNEMFKLKDRNLREFCLGPTHEEIFTDIVRNEVKSYKQLPLVLYQIQTKYRDEIRPRFGAMRSKEFLMKDAYSFDIDENGLDISYKTMFKTYTNIFKKCGLNTICVEADSGAMGGTGSGEFMVTSEIGEAEIALCKYCGYSANLEKASSIVETNQKEENKKIEKIYTPNVKTINELVEFLNETDKKFVKTLIYKTESKLIAVLVRGDREVNETKAKNFLGLSEDIEMADSQTVFEVTGAQVGFAGPIGVKTDIILVDSEVAAMFNFIVGANETDFHYINVNYGRDFTGLVGEFRNVKEGDLCPKCSNGLNVKKGIEVGHIFKLGTKYSKTMAANYLNENGESVPIIMGSYGIGINRTIAAIIEQHHDENGIIWPITVAPYTVVIIPVNTKDEVQFELAAKIYNSLSAKGIETVLDDRDERAGVKFKDADLIGFPIRITVGKKASESIVEFKERQKQNIDEISWEAAIEKVNKILEDEG